MNIGRFDNLLPDGSASGGSPPQAGPKIQVQRPLRAAISAFVIAISPMPDAGTRPIPAAAPDRAPTAQQRLANYAWLDLGPVDAGTQPTPVFLPDRARGAVATLANYAWTDTGPLDAGLLQPICPTSLPNSGPPPRRTALSAYTILVLPMGDTGVAPIAAPVVVAAPDRAAPAARSANANYWIDSGTPNDAGTLPTPWLWPDRARGPQYRSAAYAWIDTGPVDAGTQPIPVSTPYRAPGSQYRPSAYSLTVRPAEPVQAVPIAAAMPDRGRRIARHNRYAIIVPTPVDAGIVTFRPIKVDSSAATLLIVADASLEEVDPSFATLIIVSDAAIADVDTSSGTLLIVADPTLEDVDPSEATLLP